MSEIRTGAFMTAGKLVLASASPRRRELLASAGLSFEVRSSAVEEPDPEDGEGPQDYARRMAEAKAREVAARRPGAVVLAADTVVAVGGAILNKPKDEADARRMLGLLSGRTHQVVTGCCLIGPGRYESFAVTTDVTMRTSTPEELFAYVATGEPMDKAGAYAIQGQGGFLVERIDGSYSNVVGLPLAEVVEILRNCAVIVPRRT